MREKYLNAILEKGKIYAIGGLVRDALISSDIKVKDKDYLITGIPLQALIRLLEPFGEVKLAGKSFGILKFKPTGDISEIDFALPREEYSVGVGHKDFVVKYDYNLSVEEDAIRRDFTCNSISYDLQNGEYIDPLNGLEDIKNKKIRMIAEKSFLDDPLRLLRAIQFSARFNFDIEEKTLNAMKKYHRLIKNISAERIREEIDKLLMKSDKPSKGFRIMSETGLLKEILPELEAGNKVEQNSYHKYDILEHSLITCDSVPKENFIVRLTALLHDIGKVPKKRVGKNRTTFYNHEMKGAKMAREILLRLRYPNEIMDKVCHLVAQHMFHYTSEWTDASIRRFIKRVGIDNLEDIFLLREADRIAHGKKIRGKSKNIEIFKQRISNEINKKSPFGVKDLALNGNNIMDYLKIPEGLEVGKILNMLLEFVLDNPEKNYGEALYDKIDEYFGKKR